MRLTRKQRWREVCAMSARVFRALRILAAVSFALSAWSQVSAGQSVLPNGTAARSLPEPYVAEFRITTLKTSADGTTLTQEFTEVQAWDAQGRTLTAITSVPATSDETPTTKVRVSDPVTRISSSWDSNGKVATVVKRPGYDPGRGSCPLTTPGSVSVGPAVDGQASGKASQVVGAPTGPIATVSAVSAHPLMHVNANTTIEHLGTQAIQGFEAHGSRITQTTLAGAVGNSRPLVSSRESWQTNVHGIGITVREVDDDPQNGKRITELVKFSLEEPDPASFEPPPGYQISTQEPHPVSCSQPAPSPQ
jgi:hypothetical protein